ncbi:MULTISPECIES: glycosyltransferase [unclassified Massilia]|uniref:glycosyltransferase n=1 Tax=unclassified Massilia TaxID=2609279 RepID=UPI001785A9DF|nr:MULTISPECIES: glycosyltransferase [unclassified Massilia]MBD8530262.1 glycosyltransferase [Massilia sp. CFBP 13647]MBD8673039.1 glycosyltransferase [Massilia sp. CFBP 13721]
MKLNEALLRAVPVARPAHLALISEHAAPLSAPGKAEHAGQDVYVASLAHELALAGVHVDIFTRRSAPAQKQVVPLGDKVQVIHVPAGPPYPLPKEQLLPYMDRFARFVIRFARRLPAPYDIVHANFFMSGMVAQQLKLALGIPYVITFHALSAARRQGALDAFPPERSRIESALMREADRVIAQCAQDRLDMEQLYGADPQRITVAPRGFDPNELWPLPRLAARAQLGLAPGRFTVLHLGRLAPRKGIDTAFQGLAMLRERHRIDADLVVVGADDGREDRGEGAELARLKGLAHQLGIGAHVRFAGQQPRAALRLWYGAADVFVSTPWYEPFGITPVEAMACARPVIGAEVGGIKSTVVDGLTGFLIPSRDPRALAERLALLHADPALGRRMGEEGLLRAWRHYTWRAVARQACAVYATVLDETQPGMASGFTPF